MSDVTRTAFEWPEPRQFKHSIKVQFALHMSLLILLLMLATGWVISEKYVETTTQHVIDKLLVQARAYSGPAGKLIISSADPDVLMLNNICRKLASDNSDVYWAGITNNEGQFIAHTDLKQVIAQAHLPKISGHSHTESLRPDESLRLGKDTILIVEPIMDRDILLGELAVASSAAKISAARWNALVTVASITLLMVLVGLPVVVLSLQRKLRPISTITNALKKVSIEEIALDIPVRSKNEFGYLSETLRVLGSRLSAAQRELVEKQRIEQELEIAREIQFNILPRRYPRTSEFEFAGTYHSAKEVGGDYYDFIDLDDRHLAVLIADVSGKSLPGMLVMLITRDIVARLAHTMREPAALLSQVNRELMSNIRKGMFVTMFYGVLDKLTGEFAFASAGHNPWISIDADTGVVEAHKTRGYPLGIIAQERFDSRLEKGSHRFSRNEWLILYTDGVNEAHNSESQEFGMEQFLHSLQTNKQLPPDQFVQSTIAELDKFVNSAPQYDDITLLAMQWTGAQVATVDKPEGAATYAG